MPMPEDHRQIVLEKTRSAAAALLEDLDFMLSPITTNTPSHGDIRRLSVALRRLLVDRDLTIIASARTGRFTLQVPDNKDIYEYIRSRDVLFFGSGSFMPRGDCFSVRILVEQTPSGVGQPNPPTAQNYEDLLFQKAVDLTLDGFLKQNVLFLRDRWVNRRDVIKYAANITSGAHSDIPSTDEEVTLALISGCVKIHRLPDNKFHGEFKELRDKNIKIPAFRYLPDSIDPVQLELLAAAECIVRSESTIALQRVVKAELSL